MADTDGMSSTKKMISWVLSQPPALQQEMYDKAYPKLTAAARFRLNQLPQHGFADTP